MAKRKNHDKRTDLYEKAKNSRPAEDVGHKYAGYLGVRGNEGSGMFIVKPASITDPGNNSPFIADPGGTKWLPPQKDK